MSICAKTYVGGQHGSQMTFMVDINGPKKGRNMVGADIFFFTLKHRNQVASIRPIKFQPGLIGLNTGTAQITPTSVKNDCSVSGPALPGCGGIIGGMCAMYIQQNGWKIPKDYPIKF